MVNTIYLFSFVEKNSRIISTDEDPSLRIESSTIINLQEYRIPWLGKYRIPWLRKYRIPWLWNIEYSEDSYNFAAATKICVCVAKSLGNCAESLHSRQKCAGNLFPAQTELYSLDLVIIYSQEITLVIQINALPYKVEISYSTFDTHNLTQKTSPQMLVRRTISDLPRFSCDNKILFLLRIHCYNVSNIRTRLSETLDKIIFELVKKKVQNFAKKHTRFLLKCSAARWLANEYFMYAF